MIDIKQKSQCMGCAACSQICPKNCITMKADNEGFLYPIVNTETCINCGACDRVCPVSNTKFFPKDGFPSAWLVYDKDVESRKRSAAGGGFSAIAREFILKYGGVVFGAAYDDKYYVHHCSVECVADLTKLQKSKYIQSDVKGTFLEVREYLNNNRYVLYSGTPCQIYGLKRFLGTIADSSHLYCIDLSCHGVPSPKVFQEYLKSLETRENSKLASFTMRGKEFKKNAYAQGFYIQFDNGTVQFNSHLQDMFGRCFWGEIASRPSCYECHFKTIWRAADITLGDCWFFNCYVPKEQDAYGVTLVLAHSEKGKKMIEGSKCLAKYSVPADELIKANGGMLYRSAIPHKKRTEFFEKLGSVPFDQLVDEMVPAKQLGKKQKILEQLDRFGIRMEILRRKNRNRKLKERLEEKIPITARGEIR